ncbi:MAG: hypothetical protein JWO38_2740 [Gemmataceae bacterium]|nr:hypothetical protein [Gemmataceae bacterium]
MGAWYYSVGGARRGPVTATELRALAGGGSLRPSDLVWRKGLEDWVPAARISGLFPADRPPPLPGDGPPPVPGRPGLPPADREPDGPVATWEAWQIVVFSIITFGLFGFYLVPSWARQVERITGRPRLPCGAWLVLGIGTLGLALMVAEVVYAYALERHGRETGRPGARAQLGPSVLVFNVVALVWSLVTAGVGILAGGMVLGIWATWLVQAEINLYAGDDRDAR